MNCTNCQELLVSYIEALLDDTQTAQVEEHVKSCQHCQLELEKLQDLQFRLLQDAQAASQSDFEDDVMTRIFNKQNSGLNHAPHPGAGLRIRRLIMNNPLSKIAAVIVAAFICFYAISVWPGGQSVSLAEVWTRVKTIQAYRYRETSRSHNDPKGDSTSDCTVLTSEQYGLKKELNTVHSADNKATQMQLYYLPHEQSMILINVTDKMYTRMDLDEATLNTVRLESCDPRLMVQRLLDCEYTTLKPKTIDNKKVQGYETRDPDYLKFTGDSFVARLWVDVETLLPVRHEIDFDFGAGWTRHLAQYDYQWDLTVSESDFTPEVPSDFNPDPTHNTQAPSLSEQGFIEVLQMAADLTGSYPAELNTQGLQQLAAGISRALMTDDSAPAQRYREQLGMDRSTKPSPQIQQQLIMKLTTLTAFPRVLSRQNAEPVYHGDLVRPGDKLLPLMHWKTPQNSHRVLFGDLHLETVTPEQLNELQAALPQ